MLLVMGSGKPIPKDPLLDKPFNFYSKYLQLASYEKEAILEQEIVEYYKSLSV
jgi:hypothetical protein